MPVRRGKPLQSLLNRFRSNHIALGKAAPTVAIQYAERPFFAWHLPVDGDWKKSIEGGMEYAVEEAAKQFDLRKNDLDVEVSDPGYQNTRKDAREWAQRNMIIVYPKENALGLASSKKQLKEINNRLFNEVAEGKLEKLELEIASLKVDNRNLKKEIIEIKEKISELYDDINNLFEMMDWMKIKMSGLKQVEKVLLRKLIEAARAKCLCIVTKAAVNIPMKVDNEIKVVDWHALFSILSVVNLMNEHGLTKGLQYVKVVPLKLNVATYEAVEQPEIFVQVVINLPRDTFRSRMENVLAFVYPDAEQEAVAAEFPEDSDNEEE